MDQEEFFQLSAEYVAGALSGDDLRRFEDYLRRATGEELVYLSELMSVASLLSHVLDQQTPPARVKRGLMQKVRLAARARQSVEQRTARISGVPVLQRWSWLPVGIAVVAIVMIIGFSVYLANVMGVIERQSERLAEVQKEKHKLATQLVELRDELSRKEELLKVLSSRRIEITVMNGLSVNPIGYGKILWDPDRKTAILQVSNLPAVPGDKDYQLWVVKGKQPVSAGIFSVSTTEPSFFRIENLAVTDPKEISAFAITLEPKGGVPQPTGAMYMMGSPKL